jgi:transposase-like protein
VDKSKSNKFGGKPIARRSYDSDFKKEAVRLSEKKGVKTVALELGISQPTLSKWRKQILNPKAPRDNSDLSYEELLKRNKKLEKEIGYLKDIAEVLKKSTAFFSKDYLGDSE